MNESKSTTSEMQKASDVIKQKHRVEMEKVLSELGDARDGSHQTIIDLEQSLLESNEEMKSIKTMAQK